MRAIILLLTILSILSGIDINAQNLIYAKDMPTEKIRIILETAQGGKEPRINYSVICMNSIAPQNALAY